jgi:hypothetical protein
VSKASVLESPTAYEIWPTGPFVATRLTLTRPERARLYVKSAPPVTNDVREQSPETVTAVESASACARRGSETRLGFAPGLRTRNASTLPLVSPGTRFVAAERKAMQRALWSKLPDTAAPNDGPSAGAP